MVVGRILGKALVLLLQTPTCLGIKGLVVGCLVVSWYYWGLPSDSIRFHLFHVSDARNKAILLLDAVNWNCFDPVLWICVIVYGVTA
jgi:hypothetical protein